MQEINSLLLELSSQKIKKVGKQQRIGLAVPIVRSILKKDLSFIGTTTKEEIAYWNRVWNDSPYYEARSLALYRYQHQSISKSELGKIIKWMDKCDCWEHCDDLSKIYATVVEENPTWILPTFKKWNCSSSLWKRRQSVVGLIEYNRKRNRVLSFEILTSFVTPLLADDEYYVQKGVGWTLREIFNAYPEKTKLFIEENLFLISSTAYSAATEKLEKVHKQKLNLKRKKNRRIK